MQLGHLLTRSGFTYPEVYSKFYHDSFCQLGSRSVQLLSVRLPVVKISPQCVTGPEQGKSSGRIATLASGPTCIGYGISSIPGETVIPLWLGRHFLVCENRIYHEKVSWMLGRIGYSVKLNRNYELATQKCLLSFSAESFVFQVAIQKFKDQDI